MKVCFYAINGHGLGHLSRCNAIATRLRDLALMIGGKPDIQILTTSEADHVVEQFPVFKIPSRSCFRGQPHAASRYKSNGKMMVSAMLSHFSPDLLVMDTVATGSFNEFTFIKDFAKKTALVERHKNEAYTSSELHQTHLGLFDKILIPDEQSRSADYPIPESLKPKASMTGMVHNFDAARALSREAVRQYFDVGADQKLIFLSAGGGGDSNAQEQIESILAALSTPQYKVVIAYGPLSKAPKPYGRHNVIPYTETNVSRFFNGFDLALSAAGYNTYEELLAAQVPTLFFAQDKGLDMQERRIAQGVDADWHGVLDFDASIPEQVQQALQQGKSKALLARPVALGASQAAKQLASMFVLSEDKRLELELAALAQSLRLQQHWTSSDYLSAFQLYKQCIQEQEPAHRLNDTLEALSTDHASQSNSKFLNQLHQAEWLRNQLDTLEFDSPQQKKRFLQHLQKNKPQLAEVDAFIQSWRSFLAQ